MMMNDAEGQNSRSTKNRKWKSVKRSFGISWKEVDAEHLRLRRNISKSGVLPASCVPRPDAVLASQWLPGGEPVYVSLATISKRVEDVAMIICDLIGGTVVPDEIFVLTSSSPYLLDEGVPLYKMPVQLVALAAQGHPVGNSRVSGGSNSRDYDGNINRSQNTSEEEEDLNGGNMAYVNLIQTDNFLGPHRKLLPLLAQTWKQDVLILTMDDDMRLPPPYLEHFLSKDVQSEGRHLIAGIIRRIGVCVSKSNTRRYAISDSFLPYNLWVHVSQCHNEVLVLPIGRGSVLYRPRYFHPIIFDSKLRKLTFSNDDLTFRLATLINRVPATLVQTFSEPASPPKKKPKLNNDSLFYQLNKASNNYSNILQWNAGMSYIHSKHLIDHPSMFNNAYIQEREWYCSFVSYFPYHSSIFKECAMKSCSLSADIIEPESQFMLMFLTTAFVVFAIIFRKCCGQFRFSNNGWGNGNK